MVSFFFFFFPGVSYYWRKPTKPLFTHNIGESLPTHRFGWDIHFLELFFFFLPGHFIVVKSFHSINNYIMYCNNYNTPAPLCKTNPVQIGRKWKYDPPNTILTIGHRLRGVEDAPIFQCVTSSQWPIWTSLLFHFKSSGVKLHNVGFNAKKKKSPARTIQDRCI